LLILWFKLDVVEARCSCVQERNNLKSKITCCLFKLKSAEPFLYFLKVALTSCKVLVSHIFFEFTSIGNNFENMVSNTVTQMHALNWTTHQHIWLLLISFNCLVHMSCCLLG